MFLTGDSALVLAVNGFRARRRRRTAPVSAPAGRPAAGRGSPPEQPPEPDTDPALAILIVTSEAPPVVSGIATTVALLRRGLTEQGHCVDVVSRDDYPRFVRGEFRFSAFAFYWPALRRRLAGYDVVNLHGPVPTISEVFLLLARTLRRHQRPAIVYTHHSDLSITALQRVCALYNRVAGRVAQSADAIVVSSAAYHHKLDRPRGTPVSVIPWAIDPPGHRPHRVPSTDRLRVLFVGQLRGYKGLHVLLDAVSGLPEVMLTIVGDGPLRAELAARVRGDGLGNVVLAGRISDAELLLTYAAHQVVVLPSTTTAEAYGLVLAEGMAAGCVPVASALPGVSELAGATGLLVPPGDAAALRAALRSLAERPLLLQRLSTASLDRSRHLSVDAMAEQYGRVFRSAVASASLVRAGDAVPRGWQCPADLLEELGDTVGVRFTALSHVSRTSRAPLAEVWLGSAASFRDPAPAARLVAALGRPVLDTPGLPWDASLPPLMRRAHSTSSILLPVHWTRRGVSVVELWTTPGDPVVLGRGELSKVLRVMSPSQTRSAA